jgi:hypothetical protein
MSRSMSTGGSRLTSTLPTPQLTADSPVSMRPATVRSRPTVSAISASPASATAVPVHSRARGHSPRASAANRMVKSAWLWPTIEARPGGIPEAIPKNCRRN